LPHAGVRTLVFTSPRGLDFVADDCRRGNGGRRVGCRPCGVVTGLHRLRLNVPVGPRVERGVFALGVMLRVYLALVNREANDDHLSVIRIIAFQHHLPRLREAWEGFQPKLYHVTTAILWNISPWQSPSARVVIAQLVACAAGIATLFIIRNALIRHGVS